MLHIHIIHVLRQADDDKVSRKFLFVKEVAGFFFFNRSAFQSVLKQRSVIEFIGAPIHKLQVRCNRV